MSNPNENCLEGMRCPKCGSYGSFNMVVIAMCNVSDEGTQDFWDVEWEDGAHCECTDCHHFATVKDFREPEVETQPGG